MTADREQTMTAGTVAGRDVEAGQTIKDKNRWYAIQEWVSNPLWDGTDMRVADALDAAGKTQRVPVFDGDIYPLRTAGRAAPVIIRTRDGRGGEITVEIAYRKREYGGWHVVRADNGRQLGWLTTRVGSSGWSAHVDSAAFRGDTVNDTGDLLDDVPLYLFNGEDSVRSREIGWPERTREDAAEQLVAWLARKRATALGYGRHPEVTRWEDRRAAR